MHMTNTSKPSTVLTNISNIVPVIILIGGMIIGYTNLHTDIRLNTASTVQIRTEVKELDTYDRYLQNQSEKIERRLLVVETKQRVLQDTQVRLEDKLDSILAKLEILTTSVIQLSTIQQQSNTKGNTP